MDSSRASPDYFKPFQVLLSQCHRFRALVLLGRFLDMGHQWRSKRALFDGNKELRPPPKEYSGDDVLLQLENLQIRPSGKHKEFGGVKCKRTPAERNWSKKKYFV